MTPVRRIAAAVLVATLGLGFVGIAASPATAFDTTWGDRPKARVDLALMSGILTI